MENQILFHISNQFFAKYNQGPREWNFPFLFYNQYIPEKLLKNAKKYYAFYDPIIEKPIILYNQGLFHIGKEGFLITNLNLYYRIRKIRKKPEVGRIRLMDIKEMEIIYDTRKHSLGCYLYVNGKEIGFLTGYSKYRSLEEHVYWFNELFQMYIDAVQERRLQE